METSKNGLWAVFWWVVWITLTILAFFAATAIWSPIIAKHFGSIRETKPAILWVTAVFGTWILFLVPLIIVMYQKVDKAYEDARIKREQAALKFRSIEVPEANRRIPAELARKLDGVEETIEGGHLVSLKLADGRTLPHVFIAQRQAILGIYDATAMEFEGKDVVDLELVDMRKPPHFLAAKWLRLDGAASPY